MRLITELNEEVKFLKEEAGDGKRKYFIEGVFLQSDVRNRNGRVYPKDIMMKEVARYINEVVNKKRAYGELGHPQGPNINLERVSHMITELRQDGSNIIGKAKIMTETPYGRIVQNLLDEGATLGVSSRGLGSLKEVNGADVVQSDFFLATAADIVADPSAPDAFVRGIMENKEWVYEGGVLIERTIDSLRKEIKRTPSKQLDEAVARAFQTYLEAIRQGK